MSIHIHFAGIKFTITSAKINEFQNFNEHANRAMLGFMLDRLVRAHLLGVKSSLYVPYRSIGEATDHREFCMYVSRTHHVHTVSDKLKDGCHCVANVVGYIDIQVAK